MGGAKPQQRTRSGDHLIAGALNVHSTAPLALGLSGCLVLEIAHRAGHTPLGTFDKTLGKLANVLTL